MCLEMPPSRHDERPSASSIDQAAGGWQGKVVPPLKRYDIKYK
jgi:hypothetical protein